MGRDGCIYALEDDGRVLKIDMANNSHCFVGNSVESDNNHDDRFWGDAILGIDLSIYRPPVDGRRSLKYEPHSNQFSLVGVDFVSSNKWIAGCLASDGIFYCISYCFGRINPWKEYTSSIKNNMAEHPGQIDVSG